MSPSQAAMSPIAWRSSSLRGSRASSRGIAAAAGSETVSSWIRAIEATSCCGDRLEPLDHPARSVRRVEVVPDQVRVVVVVDPVVRRDQVSARGIDRPRQLVERDPSVPLVLVGPAGHRRGAVAAVAQREPSRALVADRAVDVGVDEVLARALHAPRRAAELLEAGRVRGVQDERRTDAAVEPRPPQRVRLGRFERDVLGVHVAHRGRLDDRAVPRLADVDDDAARRLPRTWISSRWTVSGSHDAVVLGGRALARSGARRRGPGRRRSRS